MVTSLIFVYGHTAKGTFLEFHFSCKPVTILVIIILYYFFYGFLFVLDVFARSRPMRFFLTGEAELFLAQACDCRDVPKTRVSAILTETTAMSQTLTGRTPLVLTVSLHGALE